LRRVSRTGCQMNGLVSTKAQKPLSVSSKFAGRTKSCETPAFVASGFHFCVSVISTGQHDTAPFGTGFLSFPGADGWPLEWWQPPMSAMTPVCKPLVATLVCDSVIAGNVQPITQATTAIHRETPTAVPALTVCHVERIQTHTYSTKTSSRERHINLSRVGDFKGRKGLIFFSGGYFLAYIIRSE